jgi:hypothetical protein
MNDERTTKEIIEILIDDCDRCHTELIASIDNGEIDEDGNVDADYGFPARQLIRAIFAYIEAVTFSMKAWSAGYCLEKGINITPQERYFATDTEYELNDRGEVVETKSRIPLAHNIRFALALQRRAHGIKESFDASVEWWSCLKNAIRVRDRLTHPKLPGDLDVSGEDILDALKAKAGFEEEALRYGGSDKV